MASAAAADPIPGRASMQSEASGSALDRSATPTGPKPNRQQRSRKPKAGGLSSDAAVDSAAEAGAPSTGPPPAKPQEGKATKPAKKPKPKKDKDGAAVGAAAKQEPAKAKSKPKGTAATPATTSANGATAPEAAAKKKRRKKKKAAGDSSKAEATPTVRLKVVVRRLPPNVPEEVFWKSVEEWVVRPTVTSAIEAGTIVAGADSVPASATSEGIDLAAASAAVPVATPALPSGKEPTVDYARFVPGKLSTNPTGTKPSVHSRAYIRFLDLDTLIAFHKGYDGHLFRDSKGNESIAIVEFAPYQRTPIDVGAKKKKKDARQGTIEDDPDFQDFIQKLEQVKNAAGTEGRGELSEAQLIANLTSMTLAESAQSDLKKEQARSTPLLEHLRAQRKAAAAAAAQAAAASKRSKKNANDGAASVQKAALARKMAAQQMELKVANQKKQTQKDVEGGEGKGEGGKVGGARDSANIPTGPRSMATKKQQKAPAAAAAAIATSGSSSADPGPSKSKQPPSQPKQQQQAAGGSKKNLPQGGAAAQDKGRSKGGSGAKETGAGGGGKGKKGKVSSSGPSSGGSSAPIDTGVANSAAGQPATPKVAILKRAPPAP